MTPSYAVDEKAENFCSHFEISSPDNMYAFCRHATFWIDGQRERTCPFEHCPHAGSYSPLLKGLYCSRTEE